jgi:lysophospholipase L1-like esterase
VKPGSIQTVTFGSRNSITIPAGAPILSDAVMFPLAPGTEISISLYFPNRIATPTQHELALKRAVVSQHGDYTHAEKIEAGKDSESSILVTAVLVPAQPHQRLVVAFGDSITDGATSTNDTNSSWPAQLAARLQANPATAHIAIVNQGISGNRVLREGTATNALARFDRDVIAQPGVKWVMMLEGINDIGQGVRDGAAPENVLTLDDLIGGMKQLVERAHEHGIKAIGCTLTPYQGAAYYSDKGEEMRMAYNEWIRSGGAFDAVVDFDKATQDPANPKQIRPSFNIMDHLHPNDAGYKAMAEAVNLSIFAPASAVTAAAQPKAPAKSKK